MNQGPSSGQADSSGFGIRPYHPGDLVSLYRICVQTAECGADATPLHEDPEILGHFYAAPYAVFEPDLCFILTLEGKPCGYVLGTRDSAAFALRCEKEWFPVLRERYPLPDPGDRSPGAGMIRTIHQGYKAGPEAADYPAHLHIDLLPCATGQGQGRKLMEKFLGRLRELDVPGVHLGVAKKNQRAVRFYGHMGFSVFQEHEWGFLMTKRLERSD